MQNHLCSAASFEVKLRIQFCIPPVLPIRAFPKPMDLYEDSSKGAQCRIPCCKSQLEHCSAPSLQEIPVPTLVLGEKGDTKQDMSHSQLESNSWEVQFALLGITQAAESPGAASPCTAWPGAQLQEGSGRAGAQDRGAGGSSLPPSAEGWVCREGRTSANNREQRMQRDKGRYLPGNHYKVL